VDGKANSFGATVDLVTFLGSVIEVRMRLEDGAGLVARIPNAEFLWRPKPGGRVIVDWSAEASRVLEANDRSEAA